jgi:hypothetical protein
VLLIGESEKEFASLSAHLKSYGCHCQFLPGCLEAARLLGQESFDLILCGVEAKGFQTLLAATLGSSVSLFRYLPVEDGCWWLPTVVEGQRCFGVSALRPSEFAKALNELVSSTTENACSPFVKHPAGLG